MTDLIKGKCKVCTNEKDSICSIKKCKVKVNKSRACKTFEYDKTKVKIRTKVPSTMRPDSVYWSTKQKKAHRKQMMEALEKATAEQRAADAASENKYVETVANTAPDCLSNFRSSAADEVSPDLVEDTEVEVIQSSTEGELV